MLPSNATPADPKPGIPPIDLEEQSRQSMQAMGNVIERITPWLFAFGSWIFGGLIAFNLLVMASLITVGPIHPALLVSSAAFACALPLNVAGLFLLKLIQEMKDVGIDEHLLHAFQEADFPIEAYVPQESASLHQSDSGHPRHRSLLASHIRRGEGAEKTLPGISRSTEKRAVKD